MTRDEFNSLLTALAEGWTTKRYNDVAAHFADDVLYSDPNNYSIADRSALVRFFQDDDGRDQSCRFHNSVFDEAQQIGAAEYTYQGTYRYHGTVWIVDGKIVSWREYQHRSDKDWDEFWRAV